MNATNEVLDRIKSKHNLSSDYALAKLMNVGQSCISNYRKNRSQFDDKKAFAAAKLAEIDPVELLAKLHKERAANDDDFGVWDEIEKNRKTAKAFSQQNVIDAIKAVASGKLSKKHQAIFKQISEQCILCSIRNIWLNPPFKLDS